MSENSGLQTLKNVSVKQPIRSIPKTCRIRDRSRVFKVSQQNKVLEEQARTEQQSLDDLRYCPVTRSEKNISSYKPVAIPRYSEAIRRTFKKDKYRPSVSFIPAATILGEQPAVNIAEPVYPQLGFNPIEEIPDLTVANGLSENRQMRSSNKRLSSLLDTRALERSRMRAATRTINPDAPHIVNVKKHRSDLATLQQSSAQTQANTLELVRKLFRENSQVLRNI